MSVNVDKIVVSDKFKHRDKGFKYFIGYQEDEIVKPLCIILPQMNGYIKYFEKNMSFLLEMIIGWISTMKFGMWLKKAQN